MPDLVTERSAAAAMAVAALIGLGVGIERERSGHASGPQARFAGVRTFLLLGLLGGVAGLLLAYGWVAASASLVAGAAGLIIVAYAFAMRRPDSQADGTTEVAALVVVGLGALAGLGELALAGGACAVVVLVLGEKAELHGLVRRIGEDELRAAAQFAVLALVVLPLLPEGPYGPLGGVRPRALWGVVLLFSGLSFAGYIAQRIAGPGLGYPLTGMLGGIVSSTAVTLQFARQSRTERTAAGPLAMGAVAACTVLLPRVGLLSAVIYPPMGLSLAPYLIPPALVGLAIVGTALLRRSPDTQPAPSPGPRSPLRLVPAIQLTIALQLALMAITYVRGVWGSPGVLASAAVLGLTDVDALVLAMAAVAKAPESTRLAAQAVSVGILSNTALKLGIALVLGAPGFRWRAATGLTALGAATAIALWYAA